MLKLPEEYSNQMRMQLGPSAEAFFQSYQAPRTQGLRLNPRKVNFESGMELHSLLLAFGLEPVPWCGTGFYYDEAARPGKHPYHAAGLYYIQEPSAMSAVELLDPKPGDTVLDLAAAPGGKSTHIADKLQGKGLLIANEIHPARAKILSENIERMGVRNAVVVSAAPQQLADRFPSFFDKIMVDAPCSGEGMFRKDPEAISEWSPAHVQICAARQLDILQSAVRMLKPGGRLGYSTCTFNELENERTVEALAGRFPELQLIRQERIWPHLERGEGHFVAVLELNEEIECGSDSLSVGYAAISDPPGGKSKRGKAQPEEEAFKRFLQMIREITGQPRDALHLPPGRPLLFGGQLYWLPGTAQGLLQNAWLHGLKVLRPGLHLAEMKKDRAVPAHALALAMTAEELEVMPGVALPPESADAQRYLRGETIESNTAHSGWMLVKAERYPLGWGKQSGMQIKNHYPKGLRRSH